MCQISHTLQALTHMFLFIAHNHAHRYPGLRSDGWNVPQFTSGFDTCRLLGEFLFELFGFFPLGNHFLQNTRTLLCFGIVACERCDFSQQKIRFRMKRTLRDGFHTCHPTFLPPLRVECLNSGTNVTQQSACWLLDGCCSHLALLLLGNIIRLRF